MITSNQNPKIKLVRALLGRARERRDEAAFVIEGVRLVEEAVMSHWKVRFALFDETVSERGRAQAEGLKLKGVEVEEVSPSVMTSLSETETPQGILAVLELSELPLPAACDFILIPDQIRDPGNLGTLLRSAAAAQAQAVLIPPETTDAFAPKVLRSGMGAHFRLPIRSMNWEEIDRTVRTFGLNVFVADMDGVSCWEVDLRQPLALIVGSEAEGAGQSARALANARISIPMPGAMESLNAGVAGSILMFEAARQRSRL